MAADAPLTTPEERARAYRQRLKDEPRPAAIVDCVTAEVLAANAGGMRALGLTPADRLPAALDSAMPAITALRDLSALGRVPDIQKPLMFWNKGRATSWPCAITEADPAAPGHVMIVFAGEAQRADRDRPVLVAARHSPARLGSVAANDDSPPRVERDDGDTLKEIARRIRDGQMKAIGNHPAPSAGNGAAPPAAVKAVSDAPPVQPATRPDTFLADGAAGALSRPPVICEPSQDAQAAKAAPAPLSAGKPFASDEIAKLAHELKTPLTAIAAAAEIMRDERLGAMGNAKYLGYAGDIHASASHALAVITEMLAVGASDAGGAGAMNSFDLTELASATVSSLQPLATQRRLALTLDAQDGLTPIRANATAVRQILLNLLTNALKFTPPGGDVRVGTGYLNDGAVYLVVRDTGDGMSRESLARAFDDRQNWTTLRPGGGRGIGLKLVRRLAAENGAEFEIDSQPGKGTVALLAFSKDLASSSL